MDIYKKSIVADLLDFEANENPLWEKKGSIKTMLKEIVEFQKRLKTIEVKSNLICEANKKLLLRFIFTTNKAEDHGFKTLGLVEDCLNVKAAIDRSKLKQNLSIEEIETLNLHLAFQYLNEIKEDVELRGFLESSILKDVHKLILKDVPLPPALTKPGTFSKKKRVTKFGGEKYEYPQPDDMEEAVARLLDRYNSLITSVKNESDEIKKVYDLFKICSVLLFELTDLHPFCDGNGRLCRLLANYCLSLQAPFAIPIYIGENSNELYIQTLIETRKSDERHPKSLLTMIIESCWITWKEYFKNLKF